MTEEPLPAQDNDPDPDDNVGDPVDSDIDLDFAPVEDDDE